MFFAGNRENRIELKLIDLSPKVIDLNQLSSDIILTIKSDHHWMGQEGHPRHGSVYWLFVNLLQGMNS